MYVEPAPGALIAADGVPDPFRVNAVLQADGCGCDAVLHVDPAQGAHKDVLQDAVRMHQVKGEMAQGVEAEVFRVVVRARVIETVGVDAGRGVGGTDRQPVFQDQDFADLGGESAERLLDMRQVSVDVEMVGIHRRDGRDGGMELQEGTVIFVGFGDDHGRRTHQHVGAVVLRDAAEEGAAARTALGQDVGDQGRSGGLAVGAGDGQAFLSLRDLAEHARTLDDAVAPALDEAQFLQRLGDGGRIDHQRGLRVRGDEVRPVLVMDGDPFRLQFVRQVRSCTVITGHGIALPLVIAGDGAHADASDADEVNILNHSFPRVYRLRPRFPVRRSSWPSRLRPPPSRRCAPGPRAGPGSSAEAAVPPLRP